MTHHANAAAAAKEIIACVGALTCEVGFLLLVVTNSKTSFFGVVVYLDM